MNRKNADNRTNEKRRHRLLLLLLLLLIIAVLLTELVLLRRLGNLENTAHGQIIDTIVLSPEQKPKAALLLCGRVCMNDGTPASHIGVELHSSVKRATTGETGDFYFTDVEEGAHIITLRDEAGNELMHQAFQITFCKDGILVFSEQSGEWRFELPDETLVLELNLTMDDAAGTLCADTKSLTAILNDGVLCDSSGQTFAARDGAILTPHGSLILTDGTVSLHQGGALLWDGIYVSERGKIFATSAQVHTVPLPEGYTLEQSKAILTTPDGTDIYLAECRTVLTDGTVIFDNSVTLTDGTVIDHGKAEIVMSDGQVIRGKAGDNPIVILQDGKQIVMPDKEQGYRIGGEKLQPLSFANSGGTGSGGPKPAVKPADHPEETEPSDQAGKPDASDQSDDQSNSFSVTDVASGTKWTQLTTIDLFYPCDKLYPGVSGSYEFSVLNGISGAAFFKMNIAEAPHDGGTLPLEYRLRDAGGYVAGDQWLNAEQLGETQVTLKTHGRIFYTLEWRWPYERGNSADEVAANNRQDAALGSSENLSHEITVTIHAEAVN